LNSSIALKTAVCQLLKSPQTTKSCLLEYRVHFDLDLCFQLRETANPHHRAVEGRRVPALKLLDDVAINLVLVSMPFPSLTDYATNEMHVRMPFQHLS